MIKVRETEGGREDMKKVEREKGGGEVITNKPL